MEPNLIKELCLIMDSIAFPVMNTDRHIPVDTDSEQLSLYEARARFFRRYGLGPNGGYYQRWVPVHLGRLRFILPNTRGRMRAIPFHDLHHMLTGYKPSWPGEALVGAWELAGGCGAFGAAWVFCLWASGLGVLSHPRQVFRAFVRGRRSSNLYRRPIDLWDKRLTLARLRQSMGIVDEAQADRADKLYFVMWMTLALLFLSVTLLLPGLATWWILAWLL